MTDRGLRRKLTVRTHGASLVLIKRPNESAEHVLQKAMLWALYLPDYPALRVEVPLPTPSRYKPDLLDFENNRPRFWGECGVVAFDKLQDLLRRYRHAHYVFSKWGIPYGRHPFADQIDRALVGLQRSAPVELICFPPDAGRFIAADGTITIDRSALSITRWPGHD